MRVRMIPKMFIEGKDCINIKLIYQCKAGTICKTQFFIVELSENIFCGCFNILSNAKYDDAAFVYPIHKLNGCGMAASGFQECVDFIHNVIRTIDDCISFLNSFVDDFRSGIVLVFRNGEGAKCAGVYKNLQSIILPYRYLS